jgi:hypothetical protein
VSASVGDPGGSRQTKPRGRIGHMMARARGGLSLDRRVTEASGVLPTGCAEFDAVFGC